MTWFDKIKSCETLEEMASLLEEDGKSFCPNIYECKCEGDCRDCIVRWLEGDAT